MSSTRCILETPCTMSLAWPSSSLAIRSMSPMVPIRFRSIFFSSRSWANTTAMVLSEPRASSMSLTRFGGSTIQGTTMCGNRTRSLLGNTGNSLTVSSGTPCASSFWISSAIYPPFFSYSSSTAILIPCLFMTLANLITKSPLSSWALVASTSHSQGILMILSHSP